MKKGLTSLKVLSYLIYNLIANKGKKMIKTETSLAHLYSSFKKIAELGYVQSMRPGSTGIGYTLETLLGIKENSDSSPDLGTHELKTTRKKSNTLQTLFTYATTKNWKLSKREVIYRYGTISRKGDNFNAYNSIGKEPNKNGFYYETTEDYLVVKNRDVEILRWTWEELGHKFENKFPACIKVFANSKLVNRNEYFHYNEVYNYTNADKSKFKNLFVIDKISIDLRLKVSSRDLVRVIDKGTAFRIKEQNMEDLFHKEVIFS
jgi:hypothetical protein